MINPRFALISSTSASLLDKYSIQGLPPRLWWGSCLLLWRPKLKDSSRRRQSLLTCEILIRMMLVTIITLDLWDDLLDQDDDIRMVMLRMSVERTTVLLFYDDAKIEKMIISQGLLWWNCWHLWCCDDHLLENHFDDDHWRYEILGQCTWGQGPKEA